MAERKRAVPTLDYGNEGFLGRQAFRLEIGKLFPSRSLTAPESFDASPIALNRRRFLGCSAAASLAFRRGTWRRPRPLKAKLGRCGSG